MFQMLTALANIAFTGFQGVQDIKHAGKEATAITEQARLEAQNIRKATEARASSVRTSFLQSGFEMSGTPENALKGLLGAGEADINLMLSNARTQGVNRIRSARDKAILDMVKTGTSYAMDSGIFNKKPKRKTELDLELDDLTPTPAQGALTPKPQFNR